MAFDISNINSYASIPNTVGTKCNDLTSFRFCDILFFLRVKDELGIPNSLPTIFCDF